MCDYCSCRELPAIGVLSEEHERIAELAQQLRDSLARGAPAAEDLAALQTILVRHLAKEEAGVFARLSRRPGLAWYLGRLMEDHARVRAGLLTLDRARAGRGGLLPSALDELASHLEVEEHDLFPALRTILDDEEWEEIS